jgi:hypothetical protein
VEALMARRKLKVEDLPQHLQAEARRQLEGGGVDAASLAVAQLDRAVVARTRGGLVVDRDVKPDNALPSVDDRDVKPAKPLMNRTEAAYAEHLEARRRAGAIEWWKFESFRLRLAERTWYVPDFAVMIIDDARGSWALEFHEVKGFWRDDARVKIKVAAEAFPFRFLAVQKKRARDGGGWAVERFPGAVDRAG